MAMTPQEADSLLAARIASSRSLGGDPDLAMHGGGNTSVKVTREGRPVLHVKGSGWDLATIEAPGLPGLWLEPLLEARQWPVLSDTEMVLFLRRHLLDPASPNPSIETLLHAFLPARFVDHGHASAVLAIANQPAAAQRDIVRDLFGDGLAFLHYVFPGFPLSLAGGIAAGAQPGAEGMWLSNHGLFSWGGTADESLRRFRSIVSTCDAFLRKNGAGLLPRTGPETNAALDATTEALRSVLAGRGAYEQQLHVSARGAAPLAELSGLPGLPEAMARGTITPDHVIRTKPWPLVVDASDGKAEMTAALEAFAAAYHAYFEEHARNVDAPLTMLDPEPRVVVVRGAGVLGLGRTPGEASINADLAEQNMRVVASAEALGQYEPIPRSEQFQIEYWELEQAKLRKG